MDFLLWEPLAESRAYRVKRMDDQLLRKGDGAVADLWPENLSCVVSLDSPQKNPLLPDHLANSDRRLYVSRRLKEALEQNSVPQVEYLPIKVIDPTGRFLGEYFVVHFLNAPDCLNLEAGGATRSRLFPSKAEKLERLIFKHTPDRPLFQPAGFNKITLISWALAESLATIGFSGFRFMGLFDYGIKGDLPAQRARNPVNALCKRLRQHTV